MYITLSIHELNRDKKNKVLHRGILPETLHGQSPRDITWHENAGMLVLAAFTVLFGIMPFIFWDMMSYWSGEMVTELLAEAMRSKGVLP